MYDVLNESCISNFKECLKWLEDTMKHHQIVYDVKIDVKWSCLSGKWHLGHARNAWSPTKRGFQSFTGFFTGKKDYFDHSNFCSVNQSRRKNSLKGMQ